MTLTQQELHVMKHATAWDHPTTRRRRELFRNHFCTGPGTDDWGCIQGLVAKGLMALSRAPSELSGGDSVFIVTTAGLLELGGKVVPA